jgi:ribosome-associated translation inhibitor RaiA
MIISLIDRQRQLPVRIREEIMRRVRVGLGRFAPRIRRASLVVRDENGDKGGIDQRCRLTVRLQSWGEYIVDTTDTSVGQAVSRAVDRMNRVLRRMADRQSDRRRRWPMGGQVQQM